MPKSFTGRDTAALEAAEESAPLLDRHTALPYSLLVDIAFDADKDASNQRKHGVSLAFGAEVLADNNRLDVLDVRFEYAEDRLVSYGLFEGRVWVCVFTLRGEVHRILSVRKANDRETRRYHRTPR
ncbi:MAG TPA: BrnT family toxin [Acidobacteriota bacterium]